MMGKYISDIREPSTLSPAQVFTDRMQPWNIIASIANLGHDRFAASVARTPLVKIYDLHMPGSKVYTYRSTSPTIHQSTGHTPCYTVWQQISAETLTHPSPTRSSVQEVPSEKIVIPVY
ncbi:hypothetical protein BGX38DRAFT_441040 [Terfezia claveryi]|nr:hypothetical protein BGX38DRAFT_441040 [Terfezia claveryi]